MEYSKKSETVLSELQTTKLGLSNSEALSRQKKHGLNELNKEKKTNFFMNLLRQFKDVMILLLIFSAIISFAVAIISRQYEDLFEGLIILFIVILNGFIGAIQEDKAQNALDSLKKQTELLCKVRRNGDIVQIKSKDVCIGDIIVLEAGDIVPCDIRLISTHSLKCDESTLTGESVPVDKNENVVLKPNTVINSQINMCFSSTVITYGRCEGVAVAIGHDTEIGKIATMLKSAKKDDTPLQKSLKQLNKLITIVVVIVAILIFIVKIFIGHSSIISAFMTAVALAVGAIPESLPAIITIIMTMGVVRLSKKKAIVKRLQAVETLGSCEIICSDKTGTMTQNKMTITDIYLPLCGLLNKTQILSIKNNDIEMLLKAMILANDSTIKNNIPIGDPTETALLSFAKDYGINITNVKDNNLRIDEKPFDSIRKMMTTINQQSDITTGYTKGAFEILLKKCKYILCDNKVREITSEDIKNINSQNKSMCKKALRVLGYAYKPYDKYINNNVSESDLIFIGLSGMIDPPRLEVKDSIITCKKAGLHPVMITGDNKDTAYAIAKELGIAECEEQVILGEQLNLVTDKMLQDIVMNYTVYARVTPEHKVRIVNAFKALGKVVAMTGDGVNDAPSLKNSDIGVGMGITGTDVTKKTADLIVTDDNFATIIVAIKEGRQVFSNIQKAVQFLLSTNIVEVLCIFITSLFFPALIFMYPSQLLFVNLITDGLPAFALGVEKPEKDIMDKPPRANTSSIFTKKMITNIVSQSLIQTIILMILFVIITKIYNPLIASTMCFFSLSFIQLNHSINCKTQKSIFSINIFENLIFNISIVTGILANILIYIIPFFRTAFKLQILSPLQWGITIAISLSIIPLNEIYKLIVNKIFKNKKLNNIKIKN